ncbi:hypothetical protein JW968_06110 [Candidatus Woesearchaeota archaeon]|nr:hypothetical protein [Candidatus Woesearchaeota archaeon]
MEYLAIVPNGLENVGIRELKEFGIRGKTEESAIIFQAEKKDIVKICYEGQSFERILILLEKTKIRNPDDLKLKLDFRLEDFLKKDGKIAVRCVRRGEHNFSSSDAEQEVARQIDKKFGLSKRVSLENPDVLFVAYVNGDRLYLGIDAAGFELGKRQYKIFNSPVSLKGPIAYGIVKMSGFKKGEVLLDPFCNSGEIVIEGCIHDTGFPVHYFDKSAFRFAHNKAFDGIDAQKIFAETDAKASDKKSEIYGFAPMLKDVKASQKNAKIAGIHKQLKITRVDTEWVELKFKENEVDHIVSRLPIITKFNEAALKKSYDELFYQAKLILKKNGNITVMVKSTEYLNESAERRGFRITEAHRVMMGKDEENIVVLKKV